MEDDHDNYVISLLEYVNYVYKLEGWTNLDILHEIRYIEDDHDAMCD